MDTNFNLDEQSVKGLRPSEKDCIPDEGLMDEGKIWPQTEQPISESEKATLTRNLNDQINRAKQKDRKRFMTNAQNQLNQKIEHYKKIKNRWLVFENISDVIGIVLTVGTGLVTVIATSGTIVIPVVVLSLTSSSMLGSLITALTGKVFINRHKRRIKLKLRKTETVLNKLHLFFEKCKEDNIITLKEMEEFEKIYNGLWRASGPTHNSHEMTEPKAREVVRPMDFVQSTVNGQAEAGEKIKPLVKEKKTKKSKKKKSFRDEEMERLETGIRDIKEQLKTMDFNGPNQ